VFLDLEMAGVGHFVVCLTEWPAQAHRDRPSERDPEGDPRLERRPGPEAALDLAEPGDADPDLSSHGAQWQSSGSAGATHLTAERGRDGDRLAGPRDRGC
jgi:hypothetical protein